MDGEVRKWENHLEMALDATREEELEERRSIRLVSVGLVEHERTMRSNTRRSFLSSIP
jgi:hypothetical protein